jgi:maltose alpha-D-glucosyltransferase/alpha-amylase
VVPEVEVRAGRWERDVRAAFLAGYFAQPIGERSPLPEAESSRQSLIALFEMEKLFYELNYELNNRPDWVWIPLRGIAKLF